MGIAFDFVKGEGPVIHEPIRTRADIARLRDADPRASLAHVLETIRILRRELADRVPLIGFGGAPFTLASYAVEGGPSSNYAKTKALMYGDPAAWRQLCDAFATTVGDYLVAQVEAGAQAIQIFDSWIGALSPDDYREFARPHTERLLATVAAAGVPVLHFGTGTATLLEAMTRGGRRRDRGRLARPRSTRPGIASARIAPYRATWIRPCCSDRPIGCSPGPPTSCDAPVGGPATSSTSVTAFCRRPPSSMYRRSRASSTSSGRRRP